MHESLLLTKSEKIDAWIKEYALKYGSSIFCADIVAEETELDFEEVFGYLNQLASSSKQLVPIWNVFCPHCGDTVTIGRKPTEKEIIPCPTCNNQDKFYTRIMQKMFLILKEGDSDSDYTSWAEMLPVCKYLCKIVKTRNNGKCAIKMFFKIRR